MVYHNHGFPRAKLARPLACAARCAALENVVTEVLALDDLFQAC